MPTRYTAEEFWTLPGEKTWELWDGVVQEISGAGGLASWVGGAAGVFLSLFARTANLGLVTAATGGYIFARDPDTVVSPDAGFIRWQRLPGGVVPKGFAPVPPDLAVEVISPTHPPGHPAAKLVHYRRAGVPLVWWVDPDRRTVAVYRHGELIADLGEGDVLNGGEVMPGFALPVAEIFA